MTTMKEKFGISWSEWLDFNEKYILGELDEQGLKEFEKWKNIIEEKSKLSEESLKRIADNILKDYTSENRENQRKSFVYGNIKLDNDIIDENLINDINEKLKSENWIPKQIGFIEEKSDNQHLLEIDNNLLKSDVKKLEKRISLAVYFILILLTLFISIIFAVQKGYTC